MSEREIVRRVAAHLERNMLLTFEEIPLAGRYVDLVGYSPSTMRLVMVEAKQTHWKSALRQAAPCRLFTDEVYIAVPEEFVHRVQKDALRNSGIGLISVGAGITICVEPQGNSIKSKGYADAAYSLLERLRQEAPLGLPS